MQDSHIAERPGWRELDSSERIGLWDRFDKLYSFRPGMTPSTWPAIQEPVPSITFDLSTIPDGPPRAVAMRAINSEAQRCFVWALGGEPMIVLDWQHTAWRFSPTDEASNVEADDPINGHPTVYPDGDYYAFMTTDLREGTFGHPWERTLCVMGDRLVSALGSTLSTWLATKRTNGL